MRVVQKYLIILAAFGALLGLTAFLWNEPSPEEVSKQIYSKKLEQRAQIAKALMEPLKTQSFPEALDFDLNGSHLNGKVTYTIDETLQKEATKLLSQYKPDYGAVFMYDAVTGKVLVFTSFQRDSDAPVNLISRGTYPAASIFKIITAATAVDRAGLRPSYTIRFNGGNYTLYKKNVLSDKINRWTRTITLRDAFARSINTAFGRLSLEKLDPKDISEYSQRFMFNQPVPADFPVDTSIVSVPEDKGYALTEVASGFNKLTRMSPVQGAMIAGAVINDGRMMMPYLVDKITADDGQVLYEGQSLDNGAILSADAAGQLKEMMEETIVSGTSRKSFRPLVRDKNFRELELGGKTGHMTGDDPKGRVDWFVGYAADGDRKLAIAALTVNKKFWTVKSSYLAKTLFRRAFYPHDSHAKVERPKPARKPARALHAKRAKRSNQRRVTSNR